MVIGYVTRYLRTVGDELVSSVTLLFSRLLLFFSWSWSMGIHRKSMEMYVQMSRWDNRKCSIQGKYSYI